MRRDVNNKIKNGQNLWRPSLFISLNGLRYISSGKALLDNGSEAANSTRVED
jgi:hypothetical protein